MTKKQKRRIKTFVDDYGRHALVADRHWGPAAPVRDVMRLLADNDAWVGISAAYMPVNYQPRHAAGEA